MILYVPLPKPVVRWGRFFAIAALVGVISGLAAVILELGLHYGVQFLVGQFTDPGEARYLNFRTGLLLLPALGGLVAGSFVYWLNPADEGRHGTDLYIQAFHRHRGVLPLRGPSLNAAGCIGVISCGGSAGPEGPIAALGAAIGAALGRLFSLTPREKRIMLIAGCGAGIGAIFQCPLGGALFAAGVLYREPDFETDAIAPACISSVVSYSVFMSFWGHGSYLIRGASTLTFLHPLELIPYLGLGVACGLMTLLLRTSLRSVHDLTVKVRLPRWVSATLGGLATGAVACILPPVMDGQFVFIQNAVDGRLLGGFDAHSWWWWAIFFGAVAVAKCIATGFTISSGAPGGVLGPSVAIGGMLGACAGALVCAVVPESLTVDPENILALENLRKAMIPVGMAGLLAGSMRVPLAALVMVTEMTGSYGLIVPLMLVCFTSYMIGRRWGISDEQVPSSVHSPTHAGDSVLHLLDAASVAGAMNRSWPLIISPHASLKEMIHQAELGTCPDFVVVENGELQGVISIMEIREYVESLMLSDVIIAADLMTTDPWTVTADDSLSQALGVMAQTKRTAVPVVNRPRGKQFIGMITAESIHRVIREQLDQMKTHLFAEHGELAVIESEEMVHQLALGTSLSSVNSIQRLMVPLQVIGRSLRAADFRSAFGIQVIAIEYPDGSIQCPPDVDAPLRTNQRLIGIVATPPEGKNDE